MSREVPKCFEVWPQVIAGVIWTEAKGMKLELARLLCWDFGDWESRGWIICKVLTSEVVKHLFDRRVVRGSGHEEGAHAWCCLRRLSSHLDLWIFHVDPVGNRRVASAR
jgi:hypothetical protein